MFQWFTKTENLALVVSAVSLLISVAVPLFAAWNRREKYRLSVIDYHKPRPHVVQLLLCIENLSESPLVITDIKINGVSCAIDRRKLRESVSWRPAAYTAEFPLALAAHGATYCYLEFSSASLKDIVLAPDKALSLQIRSTLRQEQKTVLLGSISDYLHSKR